MWCVVKSMVRPGLCLVRRSQVARLAYGSIPEVGSSRMTISEPPIRAMATLKSQILNEHMLNYSTRVKTLSACVYESCWFNNYCTCMQTCSNNKYRAMYVFWIIPHITGLAHYGSQSYSCRFLPRLLCPLRL